MPVFILVLLSSLLSGRVKLFCFPSVENCQLIGETSGIISESRCVNSIGGINLSQIYLNECSVLFFEQWQGAKNYFGFL